MVETERKRKHLFWGKFDQDRGESLPLECHCLDVAMVLKRLLELKGISRALRHAAGRDLTPADRHRLAVFAMPHDVGKSNLGFQFKPFPDSPWAAGGHIRELEAVFCDPELCDRFAQALRWDVLSSWFSEPTEAESYLLASWSHHGRPLRFDGERTGTLQTASRWWRPWNGWDPMKAVETVMDVALEVFPEALASDAPLLPEPVVFQHRFAGLVMLADWLGSHPDWFPIERTDVHARFEENRKRIPDFLRAVGLDCEPGRKTAFGWGPTFREMFGFSPRPLQALLDETPPEGDENRLLIAESETGSGKTEAALRWFTRLFAEGKVDGLYFALPTRVAARELYRRVHRYVEEFFPDTSVRPVTVLAVPGYVRIDGAELDNRRLLPTADARWIDDAEQRLRERCWAAEHPKRFLAAPIAVGTIDQALLSGVQTPHAHLRSVCLDRSLLVVDEVHASDTYMSALLAALLQHHLSVGGYALLLSATLGSAARTCFLAAAGQSHAMPSFADASKSPYPSLTHGDGRLVPAGGKSSKSKRVAFTCLPYAFHPEDAVEELVDALRKGARVLVVMNTVRRAVAVQRALERHTGCRAEWLFRCADVPCPHHGRFAPEDREILDEAVSDRFGPVSPGGPAVLVGTQTLEQSLDIDADILFTDLCPMDVMLQRIGRLHRHERDRPPEFHTAKCLVFVPEGDDLERFLDDRGRVCPEIRRTGCGTVYEDLRVLQRTLEIVLSGKPVTIPGDNRKLVEAATHPERLQGLKGPKWEQHGLSLEGRTIMHRLAASICAAIYDKPFGEFSFQTDATVATRLGADRLVLPLDKEARSPFGKTLRQMVIPAHMKPAKVEERITVLQEEEGRIALRCGSRRYVYSRFGLEEDAS